MPTNVMDDNQEWEEWRWGDDARGGKWPMGGCPAEATEDDNHRKALSVISGKIPPNSDDAYERYANIPNHTKEIVKVSAHKLINKFGGAFNFDDALVWLSCFDFDPAAMDAAIAKWLRSEPVLEPV